MGHAGALIGSAREGAAAKLEALAAAGCRIANGPEDVVTMLAAQGFAEREPVVSSPAGAHSKLP
jgi:succinyl-CoA synthetase alpha subunit